MKDVLGNHIKDRLSRLVHWLSITLYLRKTSQESIGLEMKSYWIIPWIRSVRGENSEGWQIGCRQWGVGNDGRIGNLRKKTQCKRSYISQRRWKIHNPSRPTLLRDHPILTFWVNQKGLTPPILQDSFPDAGEARNDFWSFPGNFIYHHHVEPRVKLYSPREESSLIPLKYIDVSRSSRTNLDVMQELRIEEYCNIDGSRDLSGSWTGFTQFSL